MTSAGLTGGRTLNGYLALLSLPGLLLLAWLCYSPGLGGPLLLDDEPVLLPLIQESKDSTGQTLAAEFLWTGTGPLGRPLAMASFIASLAMHGDVAGLKLDNVLLHLLCALVLMAWVHSLQWAMASGSYLASREQSAFPQCALERPSIWWTFMVGGLWMLHPMMVSTVLYTVQRMTILSTLFTLLGLLAYTTGRQRQRAQLRTGTVLVVLCFVLCLPLAVLSKENGVLLVPLCAWVEGMLFWGTGTPQQRRALRGIYALLLALPVVLAATVFLPTISAILARGYAFRDFTLGERLLTEGRVLVFYLYEWMVPLARNLSFYHDNFPVSHGLWTPWTTAVSWSLLTGVTALSWWVRRRLPLVTLGWGIFLIGHALEAGVVPLELVFEHRNYLPSAGLALALIGLPWSVCFRYGLARAQTQERCCAEGTRWGRRGSALLAVAVLGACAYQTSARSHTWGQASRLFPRLYAANPDSPRLTALFANTYANAGQFDAALQALANQATLGATLQRLDIACLARRPVDTATLEATLASLHGIMAGYEVSQTVHLANDVLEQHCGLPIPWGVSLLKGVLKLPITQPSSRQLLWLYSAHLHHASGDLTSAQADLEQSAAADPGNPVPRLLAGEWAMDEHDVLAARAALVAASLCRDARRTEHRSLFLHLRTRLENAVP